MKFKKFTALLLAALLVLSLAACGTKDNDKMADMSGDSSAMTGEPKNAEEALALHKKLMEQENTILSQNTALWEKVFMEADKGMAMVEDGKNYGDFLLDTIESAKDQFTDEEYEMLKESATEISNIENKLTELEEKYPEIMQKSMDGDMSMPAGSDTANLSVFGYDPKIYYSGRSPLEAASMGIPLAPEDVTYRCNLVTLSDADNIENAVMIDYSADDISNEEAHELIAAIAPLYAAAGAIAGVIAWFALHLAHL